MDEKEFESFRSKYDFNEYANIISNESHALFDAESVTDLSAKFGFVYIWVEINGNTFTVVYVGMAGKTMRNRCSQHQGGFKGGSTKGKKHSDTIISGLNKGSRYKVFARKSETKPILGVANISMCSVEEIAFIRMLNPEWNSLKT